MKYLRRPFDGFDSVPSIEAMHAEFDPRYVAVPTRRYPIRYLRYWFMRHALADLHSRLKRPLRVLEAGIGHGNMLAFLEGEPRQQGGHALPPMIESWDGLSAEADPRTLRRYSYSGFRAVDLDKDFDLGGKSYDSIIVLHVLEHLADPEATMRRLLAGLRPDGLLMGGSPTMPALLAGLQERWLRRKYAALLDDLGAHKHLSVISPGRVRRFAREQQLAIDLLTGTFLLRASRNPLEDRPWWLRANLAWGPLFPALGGEVYFALRRTRACWLAALGLAGIDLAAT